MVGFGLLLTEKFMMFKISGMFRPLKVKFKYTYILFVLQCNHQHFCSLLRRFQVWTWYHGLETSCSGIFCGCTKSLQANPGVDAYITDSNNSFHILCNSSFMMIEVDEICSVAHELHICEPDCLRMFCCTYSLWKPIFLCVIILSSDRWRLVIRWRMTP